MIVGAWQDGRGGCCILDYNLSIVETQRDGPAHLNDTVVFRPTLILSVVSLDWEVKRVVE